MTALFIFTGLPLALLVLTGPTLFTRPFSDDHVFSFLIASDPSLDHAMAALAGGSIRMRHCFISCFDSSADPSAIRRWSNDARGRSPLLRLVHDRRDLDGVRDSRAVHIAASRSSTPALRDRVDYLPAPDFDDPALHQATALERQMARVVANFYGLQLAPDLEGIDRLECFTMLTAFRETVLTRFAAFEQTAAGATATHLCKRDEKQPQDASAD